MHRPKIQVWSVGQITIAGPPPPTPPPFLPLYDPSVDEVPIIVTGGDPVTIDGGAGVTAIVAQRGLSDLSLNGTPVLFGEVIAESSGSRFGIADTSLGALLAADVLAVSATAVRVRHQYANGRATFVYTLSGEDLTITATVTNSTGAPITVLGFTGLLGNWTTGEEAGLLGQTTMNPANVGIGYFHPSSNNPIGAAYRVPTGDAFGVCVYPVGLGLVRSLVYWYHRANYPVQGQTTPSVQWFVAPSIFRFPPSTGTAADWAGQAPVFSSGIHPGESYTCQFGIRVSATTTWQHLLVPYKTQLAATLGGCTYADARDDRPICVSFPGDALALDPATNPYGFNGWGGDRYRFDVSATPWCDAVIGAMTTAGCQGVIFWSLNGWDTRVVGVNGGGINYNTDVQILPTEVAANVPTLLGRLEAASLTLGRESRTQFVRSRGSWTADYTYPIAASDAATVIDLLARFDTAIGLGFTRYYCDSFPSDFSAHLLLKALRDHWGVTTPLTYTEAFTDVSLLYGGVYAEVTGTPPAFSVGAVDVNGGLSLNLLTIGRWLVPSTSVAAIDRTNSAYSTAYLDFLYQHNITPFVADQDLLAYPTLPATLASYNATYLTANQFAGS